MRFATPQILWFLLLIPVILGLFWVDEKKRRQAFELFIDTPLWPTLVPGIDFKRRSVKVTLWTASLFFAIIALARPQWGTHEETSLVNGLDIMLVLDVSNSMETEDIPPSRLKKAKHLIRTLSEALSGDRLGLVAFAGSAWVASPLTTDIEYFNEAVSLLEPRMVVTQGTDIGLGLETAMRALDRGAQEGTSSSERTGLSSKIVLLISDGEDHEAKAVEAARKLKDAGIRLFVMGVGTQKGGPIPVRDENGNLVGYKKERGNSPIVSTFHPDALTQLAAIGDGKYWNISAEESEAEYFLRETGGMERSGLMEHRYVVFEDQFQFPLALSILLLFIELGGFGRARKTATSAIILLSLVGFSVGTAHAAPPIRSYLENKQGLEAFQNDQLDEARKHFGEAQARDPERAELEFNQGVLQLKEGNLDSAIQSFGNAVKKAKDPKTAAISQFNLGSTLSQKGDNAGAVKSYIESIMNAQKSGDKQLEEDARKNIELLYQQQQQKQQNQKNDKDSEDKKNKDQKQDQQKQDPSKDQKDQDKDQQKDQDQKNKDEKQQPSGYKQTKKEKFHSVKLKEEDAERVLSELKNKEQQLQSKRKKQHGTPQGLQKDW